MDTARKHELAYLALLAFVAGQKGDRDEPSDVGRFIAAWTNPERSFIPKPNGVTDDEWQSHATILYSDATPEHVPQQPEARGDAERE